MYWKLIIACLVVVAGSTLADTNELDLDLDDIKNKLSDLPELNGTRTPSVEDVEQVLKEKCDKNGGEGAYDNFESQKSTLQDCVQSKVNITAVHEELEKAKETGSMDEVFAKYCKKIPDVMECVNNVTEAFKPCLEEKEKDNLKILSNITHSVLDFACYKDGDRIAMFIAEGGVDCLQERKEDVQGCVNKTIEGKVPSELNINSIPLLIFGAQECQSFDELHKCTVKQLEKCKENTPANIIDALFKFIRKTSPCHNYRASIVPVAAEEKSSGMVNVSGISALVLPLLLVSVRR